MKKRLLSVLLAAAMVATMLAGCSSKTEPEQPANTETEAPAETGEADEQAPAGETKDVYKVAFLPTDMSATFASWLAEELVTAFEAYDDMELTVMDSKNSLETQLSNMETCVSQGYDYVILLPLEPAAEDDYVAQYIEEGTPFMNINLDDFGVEKASSVIANPYDLGTVVAEVAKANLPDDANVVILLGPSGNTDSIERRRAYDDVLLKDSNITVLDEQLGDWEKSKGMNFMTDWLQVHEIDAVLSMNDAMAIGAIEAAKEANKLDDIQFYGVDGLADAAVAIADGELDATALQDAKVMAEEGARIVHEVLTGENTEGFEKVQIPVTLITSDNVDEFITRYTENGMLSE